MTTMNYDEREERQYAPERIFLKACHPNSPNRHCSWDVSKTREDSVEYIRADLAATRMREVCAEKVRAMQKDWQIKADARRDPDDPHDYKGSYGLASGAVDACDDIITALESLTLDQVEEKQ